MENSKSLIGRLYTPIDNSWSANLSKTLEAKYEDQPVICDHLAGIGNGLKQPQKTCTIITEPFDITVINSKGSGKKHAFVIVDFQGEQHIQLFHERGLVDNNI